jgi:feruloyl esterase
VTTQIFSAAIAAGTIALLFAASIQPIHGGSKAAVASSAAVTSCEALASASLPHVTIAAARIVAAGAFTPPIDGAGRGAGSNTASPFTSLPSFCRVEITSSPASGSTIGSELWLPIAGWNGKFQAVGNRGWGGSISYPALAGAVAAGYAAASTDTGHRGGGATFALGAPEKVIDSGYRAAHDTTVIAKSLIASYYQKPASLSYWNGCSLGGRQGLAEAQRYPDDYIGIVVGDPVNNLIDLYAARLSIARTVHRSATSAIPSVKYPALHRAVLAACDRLDGVPDGVLEDPRQCHFDPDVIACKGADGPDCLTADQVETARAIYAPITHPRTGRLLSAGFPPGTELGWNAVAGAQPENNALGLFRFVVLGQPEWDWQSSDFAAAIDRAKAQASPVLDALDANLAPFIDRGGKLLLYHGWADSQTSAGNTLAYYQTVIDRIGSDRAATGLRLFMIPGMGHCEGGDGTDTFDKMAPLERWVESATPPPTIPASRIRDGKVDRARPLCPYGSVARWNGTGDPNAAASFSCAAATSTGKPADHPND